MTGGAFVDTLRRSRAHVLVSDVAQPVIDDATEHHLRRVLRLPNGAVVTVTDGRGSWRECELAELGLSVTGETHVENRSTEVTIGFAIPKMDRPEWIVQKLTELGVARIWLLHAERSVVRWGADRAHQKLEKLRRVATEALEQSRGVWLPVLDGPFPAHDVLCDSLIAEPGGAEDVDGSTPLLIGPEGGWTPDEIDAARGRFGLGPTVLRVETATIVAAGRAMRVL